MISFLEGVHKELLEYLHNPPIFLTVVVPRVPTTATTAEIPEQLQPKDLDNWSPEEWEKHEVAAKCNNPEQPTTGNVTTLQPKQQLVKHNRPSEATSKIK